MINIEGWLLPSFFMSRYVIPVQACKEHSCIILWNINTLQIPVVNDILHILRLNEICLPFNIFCHYGKSFLKRFCLHIFLPPLHILPYKHNISVIQIYGWYP